MRDLGLLQSALAAPAATFGGRYLHGDLYEMAAAYLHGIACNHPFIDGNKRVATVSALTFLYLNGIDLPVSTKTWEDLVLNIARGKLEKSGVAVFLRQQVG